MFHLHGFSDPLAISLARFSFSPELHCIREPRADVELLHFLGLGQC